ncbi:hypothetical protein LCGC14_1414000, partial [marine sediment metagenome]
MIPSMIVLAAMVAMAVLLAVGTADAAGDAKPALTFDQYVKDLSAQAIARRNERIAGLKTAADALRWARELKQWYRRRVGRIVPHSSLP